MIVPKKNGKAANYGKLTAAIVAVCDGIRTMSRIMVHSVETLIE